VKTKDRHVL